MPIRKYSPPEGPRCWADQDTRISWVHHCELNVIVIVFIPLPVPFLDLAGQGAEVEIEMVDRQASSKRSPSPSPSTSPRPRRVQQLAGEVFARHGDVDLPCNNAGVIPIGRILDTDMRDWHWVYDVNVLLVLRARLRPPHDRPASTGARDQYRLDGRLCRRPRSGRLPLDQTRVHIEYATVERVDWYNARRLHDLLDYVPPDHYQSAYYAQPQASQPATSQQ
jgi:hypothetical protein